MKLRIILLVLLLTPSFSQAGAIEKLNSFVQQTRTAKAHFSQQLLDKSGKKVQDASGIMEFSRPGKFRWAYAKPYEQLIVGDGVKLWLFDTDLNQVTVRKLDQALGSSPAALLAGSNEIEKLFSLKDAASKDGMEWLEATPKDKESTFEMVRMGFGQAGLQAMELRDNFGQTTLIRFTNLERNPKLSPQVFQFTPPKGADVIGD
jgi:chaperone LolA